MAQKTTVRIGHLKITDHLILGITQNKLDNGEESFDNLDLELQSYPGWNPLAQDLRSGKIDGAAILAPIAMELFYSNIKIRMVIQTHKAGSILIKNKRANIQSLEDFKGKTILIPHYLSVHHLLFDRLLREAGLSIGVNDVKFEVVAPSEIPEIMEWDEEGRVGGFIVAEPFGTQVVKAGYGEEFKLSKEIWPKHPCCILAVRDDLIKSNPDAVQELTDSLVASGRMIENRPNAAAEIGVKFLGQNLAVVKHVLTTDRVDYNELYPVLDDFEYIQTYMTNEIKAMSAKIDLNKFVAKDFADKAGAK